MNGKLDRLAEEMASMRPRSLPATLINRIESDLLASAPPSPWPDRFLLSAICSGAIAACVIVGTLLLPANQTFPSPPSVVATATPDPPRAGDYSLVIARAEFGP